MAEENVASGGTLRGSVSHAPLFGDRHQDRPVRSRFAWATPLALLAILLVGAYFRLTGVNWDSNTHLHPDERFITMVETAIAWPKSLGEYFDTARSPLSPYNRGYNSFVYGTLPLFLVKALGDALGMTGYDQIHLVGRVVSAAFDLGSVLLIFLIGRRLFDTRTGLLASLLTSGAVIHIQQSHFFTFDTFTAFFLLASFLFAVRVWQQDRWYDYPLLGAFFGMAVASKVNSAVFALVVGMVALKRLHDAVGLPQRLGEWQRILGWFAVAGLSALLVFRVVQPYAFAGPGFFDVGISKKFLDDMQYVQKLISGEVDYPPSIQWAGTEPYLFPLRNLVLWGMGLPLGIAGWAGLAFAAFRLLWKREAGLLLIVSWVAFFFWYQGGQMAKTMRYFVPIVPLLALLGAHLLLRLVDAARSRGGSVGGRGAAWARLGMAASWGLLAAVALGTLLYAFAFTRIYTRPVTRIEASEWIVANIPPGTPIANEHWDDPLPLRWKGKDAGLYRGTTLELYAEENPEKLRKLVAQLDATEYIFLSSNRLYGSIPRMPMRYPMTTEYYRLLFSGELGFELVKSFTCYPSLFGIELNDDAAEEIFTVYDHPKVLIFRKTPEYSGQRVRDRLGSVPLDGVLHLRPVQVGRNGLLMSDEMRAAQEQGGSWSALYDAAGLANRFPTLSWWLVLELLGLLALPLAWRLFARFPDRGYGLSKVLGLLLVSYVAWLLPSLRVLSFSRESILVGIVALGGISGIVLSRQMAAFREYFLSHRRVMLIHELLFLGAFALFWAIRVRNPDLWHLNFGGEKPMEFAFLNAVAKSTYFPPYDPWMAGGYVNYYYFGFVMVAVLMRLTGIVPAVAFNLAIPSIFALTAAGLFSFGFNYVLNASRVAARALPDRAVLGGMATAGAVLIAGNLDGPIQILEALWRLGGLQLRSTIPGLEGLAKAAAGGWAVLFGGKSLPPFDFWRSTRIIGPENPTPITEFPYFTFLYGDLHPHMMAMPLAALALGLVLAVVWQGIGRDRDAWTRERVGAGRSPEHCVLRPRSETVAHDPGPGSQDSTLGAQHSESKVGHSLWVDRALLVGMGGLVVGALQVTNSWDYPTYLALLAAAYFLGAFVRDRGLTWRGAVEAGAASAGTFVVARLLFLPFDRAYELFYNGVDPSPGKTSIQHYLVIFGFFVFCIGSVLLINMAGSRWHRIWVRSLWDRMQGNPRSARRRELSDLLVRPTPWLEFLPLVALMLVGMVLGAVLLKLYLVALLLGLGLLTILAAFERNAPPERLLLLLFAGAGIALTLGVEFVTIKGDIGRMNTVFKFYLQAWFLFGIASALGVVGVLQGWRESGLRLRPGWRGAWAAVLVLLAGSLLIYPVAATPVKVGLRFRSTDPTLDGMAYMKWAAFKDQNRDIILGRDYAALQWIQQNVPGSPVVLEAQIPEYRWGSRVSIYTGLPTVLGWTWHERQQRWGYQSMIDQRLQDIKTMFESTDVAQVESLLRKYRVRLVYVGDLERAYYSPAGLAKFEAMANSGQLAVAYRGDGVTIYEVRAN